MRTNNTTTSAIVVAGVPLILTGLALDGNRTMNVNAALATFCAPGLLVSFLLLRSWKRKAAAGMIGPRGEFIRAGVLLGVVTAVPLSLAFGNVHFDKSLSRTERVTVVRTIVKRRASASTSMKYEARVRFQGSGREKDVYISLKLYGELGPGVEAEVEIKDGAFGFEWIRSVRKAGAGDGSLNK